MNKKSIDRLNKYIRMHVCVFIFWIIMEALTVLFAIGGIDAESRRRILYIAVPFFGILTVFTAWFTVLMTKIKRKLQTVSNESTYNKTLDCYKIACYDTYKTRYYSVIIAEVLYCRENGKIKRYYYVPSWNIPAKSKHKRGSLV